MYLPEPGLEHLQGNLTFHEQMAEMARTVMHEGLTAQGPDGDANHPIRLEYMDRLIKMNCWSADDRMELRRIMRGVDQDRMFHEIQLKQIEGNSGGTPAKGASLKMPNEAMRELGKFKD